MPKTDFLFIDESGDSGSGDGDSSKYYAEIVIHVNDETIPKIVQHVVNWRYIRNYHREMKGLVSQSDINTFLQPLHEMKNSKQLQCSAVYLLKENYTGPYLKDSSPKGKNPIYFRNFIHRQLLEFHFSNNKSFTDNIELIFDRFEMTDEAIRNLEKYIKENQHLPNFKHITHADSLYSDFLQIASLIINCIKDYILGNHQEENDILCKFVELKDITNIQK